MTIPINCDICGMKFVGEKCNVIFGQVADSDDKKSGITLFQDSTDSRKYRKIGETQVAICKTCIQNNFHKGRRNFIIFMIAVIVLGIGTFFLYPTYERILESDPIIGLPVGMIVLFGTPALLAWAWVNSLDFFSSQPRRLWLSAMWHLNVKYEKTIAALVAWPPTNSTEVDPWEFDYLDPPSKEDKIKKLDEDSLSFERAKLMFSLIIINGKREQELNIALIDAEMRAVGLYGRFVRGKLESKFTNHQDYAILEITFCPFPSLGVQEVNKIVGEELYNKGLLLGDLPQSTENQQHSIAVAMSVQSLKSYLGQLSETELEKLFEAQESGDANGLFQAFRTAFGSLKCVHFLTSAPDCRSLLEYENGHYVQVGKGSFCSILTFGYTGQGPSVFNSFLLQAGFSNPNTESIQAPKKKLQDGSAMDGTTEGIVVTWDDGSQSKVPEDVYL